MFPVLNYFLVHFPLPRPLKNFLYSQLAEASQPLLPTAVKNDRGRARVFLVGFFVFLLFSSFFLLLLALAWRLFPSGPSAFPELSQASLANSLAVSEYRASRVRDSFLHAWRGYKEFAWGADELRPLTNSSKKNWGGLGVSIVDGLDTAILMGLKEEAAEARVFIAGLNFDQEYLASLFETTIRYLGGLIGAFELTGDDLYKEKAVALGDLLLFAFDSSVPRSRLNLHSHSSSNYPWAGGSSILAEIGSIQLEFETLARLTGNTKFSEKTRPIWEMLNNADKSIPGLYPVFIDSNGRFSGSLVSWGAFGDSFYEYLLKLHLLTGRGDEGALAMFNQATSAMIENMLAMVEISFADGSPTREFAFLPQLEGRTPGREMEHLTCFTPGLLVLGILSVEEFPQDSLSPAEVELKRNSPLHRRVATALLNTCVAGYLYSATGLGPESLGFPQISRYLVKNLLASGGLGDLRPLRVEIPNEAALLGELFEIRQPAYKLRPETIESLFYMFRLTGDFYWRDVGWRIFESLENHCKTPVGYAALQNVNKIYPNNQADSQESFFLAETLKYFFLLFSPPESLAIDRFVLNTEAHPIRRRETKNTDKQ